MDYEKLLDEWAERVYKEMDKAATNLDKYELGSVKYCTNKGYADGLAMSLAMLSSVERKMKRQ